MSNGLGAGFFALTLLAVLAGLATFIVISMILSVVAYRRIGYIPSMLRYVVVLLCAGILVVTGFGILALYDEAPQAAWLLMSIVVAPYLAVGVYLAQSTEVLRFDLITTMTMAWGVPFFIGLGVTFGVIHGIESGIGLSPAESRELGVSWIAATIGGITTILSMIPLSTRFSRLINRATPPKDRV